MLGIKLKGISFFILLIGFASAITTGAYFYDNERLHAKSNIQAIMDYSLNQFSSSLERYVYVTDSMSAVIESGGNLTYFETLAKQYIAKWPAIRCIQYAPDGIVSFSYPKEKNRAGEVNLFTDPDRRNSAEFARNNAVTTVEGPFDLKQGGRGIIVRKPVFTENGFWGFAIVIIDQDKAIKEANLDVFKSMGLDYSLTVKSSSFSDVILAAGHKVPGDVISMEKQVFNSAWKLTVYPYDNWFFIFHVMAISLAMMVITILLSILTSNNRKLRFLSTTDELTELKNRTALRDDFDTFVNKKQSQVQICV